jgi:predicted phosphodiesterase
VRTLIISDIHSNLTALDAVLADAGDVGEVWCLGDVVGYGPDPNACVQRLGNLKGLTCILGNHDAAVLDRIDINAFNGEAKRSLTWQKKSLDGSSRSFLENLDECITMGDLTLVHGSPRNSIWEYILDLHTARANFSEFKTKGCLVGHTHVPAVFTQAPSGKVNLHFFSCNDPVLLKEKFILNPGSVGQPRDRDPRASYVVYENELDKWEFRRVAYDVEEVQTRILQAGLPRMHACRLAEGN